MRPKLNLRLWVIVGVSLVLLGGVAAWANAWYYKRYIWPFEIQRNLFGHPLADPGMLLKYDGYSGYGQGRFRWSYKVGANDGRLKEFCGSQPTKNCSFERYRHLEPGVSQDASYKDGILMLEEWWE